MLTTVLVKCCVCRISFHIVNKISKGENYYMFCFFIWLMLQFLFTWTVTNSFCTLDYTIKHFSIKRQIQYNVRGNMFCFYLNCLALNTLTLC